MSKWKYTSYLKTGLSHEKAGTKCQDSVIVQEDEHCIVAALADGLGSLKYSDVAASAATLTVWELFASLGYNKITIESDEEKQAFAKDIIRRIAQKINDIAVGMGVPTSTMDCTLVFAYISKDHNYAITGRLGDSAICVITKDALIAINDSNKSANGTYAVLDNDAHVHMEISVWDIEVKKVYGFILTSDGLDNELYCKGSLYVNKAAEDYFNSVVVSDEPHRVIRDKIMELTTEEESPFDDDISIAVISRAIKPLTFPDDPTWLCTCGTRNRLQDTYCDSCRKDFSVIYQNICFKEYGGKTKFFFEINKHPEEERRVIGLHTKPLYKTVTHKTNALGKNKHPAKLTAGGIVGKPERDSTISLTASTEINDAPVGKKMIEKEKFIRNQMRWTNARLLLVASVSCFVVGVIFGSVLTRIGVANTIQELSGKRDALAETVHNHMENKNDVLEVPESESATIEPTASTETDETEQTVMLPEDILVGEEGVYYWGETKDGHPHGKGLFRMGGYYFFGQFVEGAKNGEFVIVPEANPARNINIVYENDEMVIEALPLDKYVVRYSLLNVRKQAGTEFDIVGELVHGDIVFRTDTPPIRNNDKEWIEIIYNDYIGWVVIDSVVPLE